MDFDIKRPENLTVRESVIENYFCEQAVEYGCIEKKLFAVFGLRSWPDRMLLWPVGVTDYVELKRPKGGKFEPGQLRTHATLRDMGFTCEVLKTKREVDAYYLHRAKQLGVQKRKPLAPKLKSGLMDAFAYKASLDSKKVR